MTSTEVSPLASDAVFAQHRTWLTGVAYRMLGSYADAQDIVQEAWVRWHANHQTADATGGSTAIREPRAWLTTVVTRLCLDQLRSARMRHELYVGPWLPEPVRTDGGALGPLDTVIARESVSLAFGLLLERLSPPQRAVYVLREAMQLPYEDVARAVSRTPAACRQLHARARARLGRLEDVSLPAPPPAARAVAEQFLAALATGDVGVLAALLTADAELRSDGGGVAAAARRPITGADKVARFLLGVRRKVGPALEVELVELGGSIGLVTTLDGQPTATAELTVRAGRIAGVLMAVNPAKLAGVTPAGGAPS